MSGPQSGESGPAARGPAVRAPGATDAPDAPPTEALRALAAGRRVVVCCGPGGVGKTTVSATFALQAARAGRRACVVTVDPARRLADSLGVESLPNTPTKVEGDWPGELYALMLDTKGTFDALVVRYSRTDEQAESIQSNRLYQNLAGALSGTQEYMAMEKLYELVEEGDYDTVVVDTPPTRNALDLLDAPRRLTHFLENRLFRALLLPTRVGLRAVTLATQALLRTISKVAGAEMVQDAVTFFQAFQGMEEGFRIRANAVRTLLADPATAYVIVTSPRSDAVAEATFFAAKLADTGIKPSALVVNRVHPHFLGRPPGPGPAAGDGGADTAGGRGVETELERLTALAGELGPGSDLGAIVSNLVDLEAVARREETAYADLTSHVSAAPVGRVPLLGTDVHDLDGLGTVADHLFGFTGPPGVG